MLGALWVWIVAVCCAVGYGLICCCFVGGGVAGLFGFVVFTVSVGCLAVDSLLAWCPG